MKATKIIFSILLAIGVVVCGYLCVVSILTPIHFEQERLSREQVIEKNLVNIRTAELEFRNQNGRFQADLDSLILFLRTAPKLEIRKSGSLSESQRESGLTEAKACAIMYAAKKRAMAALKIENDTCHELYDYIWKNDEEVVANGLGAIKFYRDTIKENMIEYLYKGAYTAENIEEIIYIPFAKHKDTKFTVRVAQGDMIPLFEITVPYEVYLSDLDQQELINLKDDRIKHKKYPGLQLGSIEAPNNYIGNWE